MNYIRYWQASGESKKTSIRTKTALGQMVQEGKFRGGSVPAVLASYQRSWVYGPPKPKEFIVAMAQSLWDGVDRFNPLAG